VRDRASIAPGIVIGLGLGGFLDGIWLHQILQWHNMGSAVLPPTSLDAMSRNMAWDGWFHFVVWLLTLTGTYMLLRDARAGVPLPRTRAFTGLLILGWGTFNLVEGVLDHHLLELHHVRDMPLHVPMYDWVFLLVGGLGLMLVGWLMAKGDLGRMQGAPPSDERVRQAEERAPGAPRA